MQSSPPFRVASGTAGNQAVSQNSQHIDFFGFTSEHFPLLHHSTNFDSLCLHGSDPLREPFLNRFGF